MLLTLTTPTQRPLQRLSQPQTAFGGNAEDKKRLEQLQQEKKDIGDYALSVPEDEYFDDAEVTQQRLVAIDEEIARLKKSLGEK